MKRLLHTTKFAVFVLLLLAAAGVAKAQTHDHVNKEWYYGFASHEIWASRYFYQHLVTNGDTVISGRDCTILRQAEDSGNGFSASTFGYFNMGKSTFYLHREPDRLLWYNEELGEFTVLHDYAAQAGDRWTIHVGQCAFDVVVDSTDVISFDDRDHRVLYVHDSVYETEYYPYYGGCIIEDVGHTTHFFPIEIYWLCHDSFLCGTPAPLGIRCVIEDGKTIYHQGEVDCDSVYEISHVGVQENEYSRNVVVYPNPVKDNIHIQFAGDKPIGNIEYQIYDAQGLCYKSGSINNSGCISVEHLSDGLFLLKLSSPSLSWEHTMRFVKY